MLLHLVPPVTEVGLARSFGAHHARTHRIDGRADASEELAESLSYFPRVSDIDDGSSPGKQQIDFQVKPEARGLGLNSREIARQIRNAYYGSEALRQLRGKNEVKVMVRFPEDERDSVGYLNNMRIRTANGGRVPFNSVAEVEVTESPTMIWRFDRERSVRVSAEVDTDTCHRRR